MVIFLLAVRGDEWIGGCAVSVILHTFVKMTISITDKTMLFVLFSTRYVRFLNTAHFCHFFMFTCFYFSPNI